MSGKKMNPVLKTVLIICAALFGLAAVFFLIGLVDVFLDDYNPHWIVKVVLIVIFLGICGYLEKDSKNNDEE